MAPEPFASTDADLRSHVDRLFFDVDDTLTWRGQLPEVAALALYKARAAGLSLVAVTGRSFAWAEMLLRMFPLDAAVAETGACALVRSRTHSDLLEVIHSEPDDATRRELARDRNNACDRVLKDVASARFALDNAGRLYDCAFDLIESGPPLSINDTRRIRDILHEEGLTTAQSSVHVNTWKVGPHGPFDKATMVDRMLREHCQTSLDAASATLCYVGDSANDGAMFARAAVSVGVGNIDPHVQALELKGQAPRYRVDGNGGRGFAEVVAALLEDR